MTRKQILCTAILVAAVVFKFWLIAPMEITDDPDDPSRYIEQIRQHSGLCYGPGTGYVGGLFYELGIPFRIGIEAAFMLAALLTVRALFEWPTQTWRALALYLFVAFNPAVEELLSHLMSDQIWLIETLAGFSFFVFFAATITEIRWLYILPAALFLGFSTITRSTFAPLMLTFIGWGMVSAVFLVLRIRKRPVNHAVVSGSSLCLYAVALFYYSTCFHNAWHNGYFGLSAFDSREYRNFYTCLQSVGEPTGVAYFPIDDDRLKLIAQAGPRSRWFVDQLDRDTSFRDISMKTYDKPGIALTWFHWAVYETIDTDGDLEKTSLLFKDIESEIAEAAREKRLTVRPVLPLPDCRVVIVLAAIPECLPHIISLVSWQPSAYAWARGQDEPKFDNLEFSQALHRRHVEPSPLRQQIGRMLCVIYSWVYAPLLPCLVLMIVAYAIALIRNRKTVTITFHLLAQQLFLAYFITLFFWYLLFAASGLLAVPRYLVFNNVMLPILLVYYGYGSAALRVRGYNRTGSA